MNQRAEPRFLAEVYVKANDGGKERMLRTRDVSPRGMFLHPRNPTVYEFTVGTTLKLALYDYDRFVSCHGVIVRQVAQGSLENADYPVGYGVRITEIDDPNRALLGEMFQAGEAAN